MKLFSIVRNILRRKVVPKKPPYYHVTQIGDPVLRSVCGPIDPAEINSDKNQEIILHMKNIMKKYDLFGLSAPQIGLPLRLFIVAFPRPEDDFSQDEITRLEMKAFPHMVWINPQMKILDYSNKVTALEGCASVKSLQAEVPRYRKVHLKGLNENGKPAEWTAEGWSARIVQHEIDHLDGHLFTDSMVPKTLQCVCWQGINQQNGLVELHYHSS